MSRISALLYRVYKTHYFSLVAVWLQTFANQIESGLCIRCIHQLPQIEILHTGLIHILFQKTTFHNRICYTHPSLYLFSHNCICCAHPSPYLALHNCVINKKMNSLDVRKRCQAELRQKLRELRTAKRADTKSANELINSTFLHLDSESTL